MCLFKKEVDREVIKEEVKNYLESEMEEHYISFMKDVTNKFDEKDIKEEVINAVVDKLVEKIYRSRKFGYSVQDVLEFNHEIDERLDLLERNKEELYERIEKLEKNK